MSPTAVVQLAGQRPRLVRHPHGELVHVLDPGVTEFDLTTPMEQAA